MVQGIPLPHRKVKSIENAYLPYTLESNSLIKRQTTLLCCFTHAPFKEHPVNTSPLVLRLTPRESSPTFTRQRGPDVLKITRKITRHTLLVPPSPKTARASSQVCDASQNTQPGHSPGGGALGGDCCNVYHFPSFSSLSFPSPSSTGILQIE